MIIKNKSRGRGERGSALVDFVVTATGLITVLMLVVQFGLMFHARNIAEQVAQEAVAAARHFDGTAEKGRADAYQLLAQVGTGTLQNPDVTVTVDPTTDTATATVTGRVVTVVPGFSLRVSESASSPVEKYVPPGR